MHFGHRLACAAVGSCAVDLLLSVFHVHPIICGGTVIGLYFAMYCFVSFPVLKSS